MSKAREIIKHLGADAITERLGVTKYSVRHARSANLFPGIWYPSILMMCCEQGLDCPMSAFNWRSQEDAELADRGAA